MMDAQRHRIELGDFQTPAPLARQVCAKLSELGILPDVVIEPTCGLGAFVLAAATEFSSAREIHGFEINGAHLQRLQTQLMDHPLAHRIALSRTDFFSMDWGHFLRNKAGTVLVIGNFPWVTNATQGTLGGQNLPEKSNFQKFTGFDAISGKSNFDISEWMLLEMLRCLSGRSGVIAMLVKTAVARKVLAYAERQKLPVRDAMLFSIDAKKAFNASVEACLLVLKLSSSRPELRYDYTVYGSLTDTQGKRISHREGFTIADLEAFESASYLLGECPQKWRSGIKHDAASVMELVKTPTGLMNGLGERVELESEYLYPLMKGSDIGSGKSWRGKYMLVTQHFVGEKTELIRDRAPKTWHYLETHALSLDARSSTIYKKSPRYAIFGVGDYAFRPWRIAICALYKNLQFRLIAPIEGKPVMFDDTVYYLSFQHEQEAREVLDLLTAAPSLQLLSSLIFWDEKRPIKTGILNAIDWSRLGTKQPPPSQQLEIPLLGRTTPSP